MTLFDSKKRILVVGDVYVDAHTDHGYVRLGGIFHAARALHAIGAIYGVAFLAPSYLHTDIEAFLSKLHCTAFSSIGEVGRSPNVIIIRESPESGDIGYDDLLRGARRIQWDDRAFKALIDRFAPTDSLIFPGSIPFDMSIAMLRSVGARLHVDGQYLSSVMDDVARSSPLDTVFLSAPCKALEMVGDDPTQLWLALSPHVGTLVVKENRGGSRAFLGNQHIEAPSFPTRTVHSIGVGDCFDAIVTAANAAEPVGLLLKRAAYYASSYAATFDHDVFVDDVAQASNIDANILQLSGKRLSWERRQTHHVYLAAPDFPDVPTAKLDALEAALRYHNFIPHRPVKENGLAITGDGISRQRSLYRSDLELLHKCSLLIAVPLTNDPGTFTELGYFSALQRPTILYEATILVSNLFAKNCASRACRSLGEVIDSVFELLG